MCPPPALTADLERKRDVLRNQLGQELGDRIFREWLERSLAAVTPEAEEAPVAEASNNGQKAVAQPDQSLAAPEAAPVVCHEPAKVTHNGACVPQVADKPAAPTECRQRGPSGRERAFDDRAQRAVAEGPRIRATAQRERLTRRWSAEEVSTLYRLHAEGLTPQAIADRLGRTKRSVIGCADRHDLKFGRCRKEPEPSAMHASHDAAGDSASGDPGAGAIPAEREPEDAASDPAPCAPRTGHHTRENGHDTHSPVENEPDDDDAPQPQPAPRDGCLWKEGEPGDHTWCGAERSPGRSYCPEHCVRAFVRSGGGRFPIERFHAPPKRGRHRARA